jgi:hypothetical protein
MVSTSRSRPSCRGQRIAVAQVLARAHGHLFICEVEPCAARDYRIEHSYGFRHYLRSDPVTRQQGDMESLHAPVTSFSLLKNCRLRSVLMRQFTGGH